MALLAKNQRKLQLTTILQPYVLVACSLVVFVALTSPALAQTSADANPLQKLFDSQGKAQQPAAATGEPTRNLTSPPLESAAPAKSKAGGNPLQNLFDQQAKSAGNSSLSSSSNPLEALMAQQKRQEAEEEAQRLAAELERRRVEEMEKQRRLAEARRQQEIAAQQARQEALEAEQEEAEHRRRENASMMGVFGAAVALKGGYKNTAAQFLEQAITGESSNNINQALEQDAAQQQHQMERQMEADRQRRELAQQQQEEKLRREEERLRKQQETRQEQTDGFRRRQQEASNQRTQQQKEESERQEKERRRMAEEQQRQAEAQQRQAEAQRYKHYYSQKCIHVEEAGGSRYLVNQCDVTIGMIDFCWESEDANCSCSRRGKKACAAGPISPGGRELITGPGKVSGARIDYHWCVYEDWKNNRCR